MYPGIPDKTYYKIGEVASLADIKTSVLRYWETEFPFLIPEKSSSGQRLYTKKDIELVLQIKQLLYHEKYTIEGVRKNFASKKTKKDIDSTDINLQKLLGTVREELQSIRNLL